MIAPWLGIAGLLVFGLLSLVLYIWSAGAAYIYEDRTEEHNV